MVLSIGFLPWLVTLNIEQKENKFNSAAAGVIDEYCVTVAPVIEPAHEPFLRVGDAQRPHTEVTGMLVDEAGFSYLRLRAQG